MFSKVNKLSRIFNPRNIAVIGATDRPNSVGLGILNNLNANLGIVKFFMLILFKNKF